MLLQNRFSQNYQFVEWIKIPKMRCDLSCVELVKVPLILFSQFHLCAVSKKKDTVLIDLASFPLKHKN